MQEKDHKR